MSTLTCFVLEPGQRVGCFGCPHRREATHEIKLDFENGLAPRVAHLCDACLVDLCRKIEVPIPPGLANP